jgi:hypothetical protein
MSRQNLVRCVCERCDEEEEIEAGFIPLLKNIPKGWVKVEGCLLCARCYAEYKKMFRRFLNDEGKHK